MQPHRHPPSFLFFMIMAIFISVLTPEPVHTASQQFVNCDKMLQCVNLQNIGYPFWGGNRPEYCGHPGFKLDCQGEAPQITIHSQTYRIFGIDYSTQTLRVARQDFWNNACPVYLHNTTVDSTLFSYVNDTSSLTLYYGCSQIPLLPRGAAQFNCSTNGTNSMNFYAAIHGLFNNSIISCLASVVAPVFQSAARALEGDSSSSSLEAALDGGFGLQWSANNELCNQCFASGGRCGYELSSSVFTCFCSDKAYASSCSTTQNDSGSNKGFPLGWRIAIGFATSVPGTIILVIIIVQYHKRRYIVSVKAAAFWRKESQDDKNIESLIKQFGSLGPKRYSYSDVEKMTNSFRDKLGQGGYGSVYKGKLSDGHLVAVKVLKETKGNGEEFINEVASISKTAHVNIVTLLGFCYESNRRALVYEFMPNGSLDKFIHNDRAPNTNCSLEWKTMYQIVVGIARGLEYLHRGCNTRIVHFDIKPQNILLGENFCPKISDFGLAKLCQLEESVISMLGARGTAGYIAPEVFSRTFGGVSHKSDVYSYGMMVLEMAGERKNVEDSVQSSDYYFPHVIYENIKHCQDVRLEGVTTKEDQETARKMMLVGLWCIQANPSYRPSMSKVVEMLNGSLESLQIPPKPSLFSQSSTQDSSHSFLSIKFEEK